jgi:hypothetical protein
MKKTFKNLILTSMLFLGSALAYDADAGWWWVTWCKSDPLLTYEATYNEGYNGGYAVYYYEDPNC